MLKTSNFFLVSGVMCVLLAVGCGGGSPEPDAPSNAPTEAVTDSGTDGTEPAETTSGEQTPSAEDPAPEVAAEDGKIGVEACDDFVAKFDACRDKLPEDQREALASVIDFTIQEWRESAKDPAARAALPETCQQAIENQRGSMEYFGCEW